MGASAVQLERRGAQRFDFYRPVSLRQPAHGLEGFGLTHDMSASGLLFYTDFHLAEGDALEMVFVMPSEITLGENMRVRARGKVVRCSPPCLGSKSEVAVRLEGYEFLPEETVNPEYDRVSALHESGSEDEPGVIAHVFRPRSAALR
ncbi:MAG: PilZ domain-containing protein [Acidobacteria bacterium]|jgi:hypothetical protein|nr:PilZ domain-containing protein [Acidobacteriota bacterium]